MFPQVVSFYGVSDTGHPGDFTGSKNKREALARPEKERQIHPKACLIHARIERIDPERMAQKRR